MRPGLTIGEFAQLTHLSVRTLRRYHEAGLLEPATVDPGSGYRYYTSEQIPAAQVIHRLRELDMPLREVREVLTTSDPDARASLVAGHLHRLESELERTGPPGGSYDNELFTMGRGDVLVYRPATDPPTVGRVRPVTLPAAELAVTMHHGPHDDIDVSYGRLGAHALAVDGPVHERYLVGPRDSADPSSWRTEIGWPIFRLSPV
ncbi:MerR family transcriptional regulator [Microbispora sp. RL4-1S]|uniref:MerR family transcriptional regulator n=1 Tax=Microbispora oryzae TaxID=2806554 RepID=A0A940WP91_9ACTN|nr:MerR family transcriptional regulator [Microbispora oryzae]MBP2706728.1 MerR family transcriptional regulator [Microbispora oryzae]